MFESDLLGASRALNPLPYSVGADEPGRSLPGAFLCAPGASSPVAQEEPLFKPGEVASVKDYLLSFFDPNNDLKFPDKLKMQAAKVLAPAMFPRLQSVNPNVQQPVTFIFGDIHIAAQERDNFEREKKRKRREARNIVGGQEVIDAWA